MRPITPLLPRVPSHALGVVLIAAVLLTTGSACQLLGGAETVQTSPDSVTVLWAGAVTDSSARVVARPARTDQTVRLAVDTFRTFATPRIVEGTTAATNSAVRHFRAADLVPETTYHYALWKDGSIDTTQHGQFRTFADGAFSFRVALGACAQTGSQHPVFDAVRRTQPDLLLHLGDMHYEDIAEPAPSAFRTAYRRVHASEPQADLFRSTALAYVWDDSSR